MRILVVEDDVQLARQIASALTEAGHDQIIVHDGERALDKAKQKPFDLIVLDVILPGIDGFEVLRHLRSEHMASRVLMLTARGEVKDRVTGLQLGADDYLPKPFAMRELVARVQAADVIPKSRDSTFGLVISPWTWPLTIFTAARNASSFPRGK